MDDNFKLPISVYAPSCVPKVETKERLFIIESLTDNDRKTGEELEARMNTWAAKNNVPVQAVLFKVNTMDEWEAVWNGIYTSIKDCANIPIHCCPLKN